MTWGKCLAPESTDDGADESLAITGLAKPVTARLATGALYIGDFNAG